MSFDAHLGGCPGECPQRFTRVGDGRQRPLFEGIVRANVDADELHFRMVESRLRTGGEVGQRVPTQEPGLPGRQFCRPPANRLLRNRPMKQNGIPPEETAPLPGQGLSYRNAELLGECLKLFARLGVKGATTGDNHGALGALQKRCGLGNSWRQPEAFARSPTHASRKSLRDIRRHAPARLAARKR